VNEALVHSYNIPAIKMLQQVGVKAVHKRANASGITSDLPGDLSLALGSADVSPLEMTGSYLPFVCEGVYSQPTFIDRITTLSGKQVYRHKMTSVPVMGKSAASQMKTILEQVVSRGTGRKASGLPGVNGGKTGTSDNNRDAWFIGFHNQTIAGVWVGHDQNDSLGKQENGGKTAAPIWDELMRDIYK